MEMQNHPLSSLFDQLGLDSSEQDIFDFITEYGPFLRTEELHHACFWSESQAAFLKEAKSDDADWAEVVDQLDAMLRAKEE
ncbi:DUF2789 family protein [Psychromonas aquimarina]|uniref:DUF2789 family protein n=1 Tax=Psychromonas aquimarina TaxID=444919 RepID=UPI0004079091|nr:DUF2789 family protein [Psychromonas aquimarina]